MEKVISYTLKEEDLQETAGGLVNLVLKNCVKVTGHEISRAKFTPLGITVDGLQAYVKDRMKPGQTLRVRFPEDAAQAERIIPCFDTVHVLYEDEDVLVADKPAGVVVHPSHGHYADSMANRLAGYCLLRGEQVIPRIVGRLDKDTSGVLLFAKNQIAAARLSRSRKEGGFLRTYLAIVHGTFPEKEGNLTARLAPVPDMLMKQQVVPEGGRCASTHYRVLCQNASLGASILAVTISTGRTHQIRVHMASASHPLIGDPLYGDPQDAVNAASCVSAPPARRAMLHAASLSFLQPFTGMVHTIEAPLPEDFCAVCDAFSFSL
ncbi:MAG: RluA family pseudouridine synthase [Lachnospiraceae bacterium]|nr:RluA family pseudouridine synthase [Lachnospiraceae bacterium]